MHPKNRSHDMGNENGGRCDVPFGAQPGAHGWRVSLEARPGGGLEAWLQIAAQPAG
jgi:hypothetical protein